MTPTPFKQGGDGGRYSGIVTVAADHRSTECRSLYVGGGSVIDNECIWIQIGSNCDDLGIVDPSPGKPGGVVYMSLEDAQGLALELLSRIRKVREETGE
jgi:hypothetical protein